ncbi:MAG: hypothetical protein ACK5PF_07190 [bacterium]
MNKRESEETNLQPQAEPVAKVLAYNDPPGSDPVLLDFDSDEPLVCNRDQSGDKPCESCQ